MTLIGEKYHLGRVFYLDLWPVATPLVIIEDPDVAARIIQAKHHPKHPISNDYVGTVVGEKSIVTSEGAEWKMLRSMLGPAFSVSHLSTLIPDITDQVVIFRDTLQTLAQAGKPFSMLDLAANVTIDVIGLVVLGKSFNAQTTFSSIAHNFRQAVSWSGANLNVISRLRTRLPVWWYCRNLDRDIGGEIQARHSDRVAYPQANKAALDLVFQAYQDNKPVSLPAKKTRQSRLDPEFMLIAVNNVKTLLLGGHDTTASAVAYAYYLLSLHPDIVDQLCQEHSSVFAPTIPATIDLLKGETASRLMTQLPLTTAVLKETLRMYPVGSTIRVALSPTETLTYDSRVLPLGGHALWVSHYGLSRRDELFADPAAFKPARFLPDRDPDIPAPPRDAWRPFEKGPRNCLGQELAMMEMKIVLLLTVREFNFESLYHQGDSPQAPERHGGRAYQMVAFSAKPAGGMPMKVGLRGSGREATN